MLGANGIKTGRSIYSDVEKEQLFLSERVVSERIGIWTEVILK